MNILRIIKVADLFTIANLCCGILAIFSAYNENYTIASLSMLLAIVMDTVDGKVAKLMNQTNRFGRELDSLADLVSFGVAPAAMYHALREPGTAIVLILILFIVCGMLRLARYNISTNEGFEGIPITVNGFLFPSLYLLYVFKPSSIVIWPVIYATMSILMVSSLKIRRIF